MARPRRLRHKLMLGLALVVGSVAVLLAGTLYGINAYLTTVHSTERKLDELKLATLLIMSLEGPNQLGASPETTAEVEAYERLTGTELPRPLWQLANFRKVNGDTVALGLDPDGGKQEVGLCDQLERDLKLLEAALNKARNTQANFGGPPVSLRNDPALKTAYDSARRVADNLRGAIFDDIQHGIERSNKTIRQSLWIVGGATAWTILLLLTLLYYFREWIFAPIRQLQAGVQRVHAGDFDHPILLTSHDELEELANEFNAMTVRLSAIYSDLARQVNERSRQLVRSERMVSVGFLAAGVAHEINNPLASILFCSEALERRMQDLLTTGVGHGTPPADAEVLSRYLTMIQQEALRCKDITQKLLDFSRTGERMREQTDLAGLIRGVLEVARHLPNCRGRAIVFDPSAYVVAPVNAQDLKSVILNLVVNSLDSMDDGGRLTITLAATNDCAEMAFADTGCGMAEDVLHNIFEPFFTRSRTGKGTGLGLFISHQIIDQHGGVIEAASPGPGRGSTFTVRVPLHPAASLPQAADGRGEGGSAGDPDPILRFPGKIAA